MYNAVEIAQKIKETAKSKNVVLKTMLEDIGMNKNAISTMISRGSFPQADNLAKIADYLNVSTDYLLGRTDYSNIENNIVGSNNNVNSNNTNSNNSNCNNTIFEPDIVSAYMSLKTQDKLEIQLDIMKRANGNK